MLMQDSAWESKCFVFVLFALSVVQVASPFSSNRKMLKITMIWLWSCLTWVRKFRTWVLLPYKYGLIAVTIMKCDWKLQMLNLGPQILELGPQTLDLGPLIFDTSKTEYENALITAGYNQNQSKIVYVHKDINTEILERKNREIRRRRNRRVIWFTPPWNVQVRTNVGKAFFKILDETFANSHLKQIFNRNNVKLGYSTTRNLEQIINEMWLKTANVELGSANFGVGSANFGLGSFCLKTEIWRVDPLWLVTL